MVDGDAAYTSGHIPVYYIGEGPWVPTCWIVLNCCPSVSPDLLLAAVDTDDEMPGETAEHCLARLRNEWEVASTVGWSGPLTY